jgi:antitoxin (DNA-binding transcriptional repressor) of toxin-antitoxin stability system
MEIAKIDITNKTLSQLLARVEAGEELVLARGTQPIAKLTPFRPRPTERIFGALQGIVSVGPEFFGPLPEGELAGWE